MSRMIQYLIVNHITLIKSTFSYACYWISWFIIITFLFSYKFIHINSIIEYNFTFQIFSKIFWKKTQTDNSVRENLIQVKTEIFHMNSIINTIPKISSLLSHEVISIFYNDFSSYYVINISFSSGQNLKNIW